jgi:hypothetical protein
VLAIFEMPEYIAMSIAIASFLLVLTAYLALKPRLREANAGLREVVFTPFIPVTMGTLPSTLLLQVAGMFTWWNSSSIVDRRTRYKKALVVQTVEAAVLKEVKAKCGEAAQAIEEDFEQSAASGADDRKKTAKAPRG